MNSPSHLGWSRPPTATLLCGPELPPLRLLPSSYIVEYLAQDQAEIAPWPSVSYRVYEQIDILDDLLLEAELTSTEVGLRLALNGVRAQPETTSSTDSGKLFLVRGGPQGSYQWLNSWTVDSALGEHQILRLLPGHYQLLYYPGAYGGNQEVTLPPVGETINWPLTTGLYAGCLDID